MFSVGEWFDGRRGQRVLQVFGEVDNTEFFLILFEEIDDGLINVLELRVAVECDAELSNGVGHSVGIVFELVAGIFELHIAALGFDTSAALEQIAGESYQCGCQRRTQRAEECRGDTLGGGGHPGLELTASDLNRCASGNDLIRINGDSKLSCGVYGDEGLVGGGRIFDSHSAGEFERDHTIANRDSVVGDDLAGWGSGVLRE